LRRALAALALLCALAPAAAADWEAFFEPSFGDLRVEAAETKKTGKQALVLMYHFDECPYCVRMKREVLSRPEVRAYYQRHFRAIAIDTRGALDVTDFDGRTMPEKEFARAIGVRATPTFQFYGAHGRLLAEHRGALYDPAEFTLLGEYVASGAYRNASFAAYKQSKQKRGS
jgi:thioredoxin-related protein